MADKKIRCSHILVKKLSEAEAVLGRIKAGEKFGGLARELSTDSGSARRDGSLGYFGRGAMVKELVIINYLPPSKYPSSNSNKSSFRLLYLHSISFM